MPAMSSAVASTGRDRPSIVSKTSPTRSPAAAAGAPSITLTISTAPVPCHTTLRTVTPMPPLSAGRSYLASRDA